MKVYFEDRYGRYREIADVKTKEQVNKSIADFLKRHNFKSYYTRNWIRETETEFFVVYDVGSHSEFFCVPFENKNEAECFIKGNNV